MIFSIFFLFISASRIAPVFCFIISNLIILSIIGFIMFNSRTISILLYKITEITHIFFFIMSIYKYWFKSRLWSQLGSGSEHRFCAIVIFNAGRAILSVHHAELRVPSVISPLMSRKLQRAGSVHPIHSSGCPYYCYH